MGQYLSNPSTPSAYMLTPAGAWTFFSDTGTQSSPPNTCQMTPPNGGAGGQLGENLFTYLGSTIFSQGVIGTSFYGEVSPNLDGGYTLFPMTIVSNTTPGTSPNETWGVLDGVYWVPGFENAAENTVTIPATSLVHTVFPNVFRSTYIDYFAVALR
jgi:hypothetical protein